MAKDISGVPVPDEITKIDNLRRNSTAKPSSATKEDNSSPHYLRASTGSCHDSCKYGKQHTFVVKARRPLRRRNPTPPLQDDPNPVEILLLTGKKSTQPVKDAYKLEYSPTMEYPPTNKSPSSNVLESIDHDALLNTKSPSVDASKSINEDSPSLFYDASSMESLLPKKSPLHDASKSIKHDAFSPTESPLIDTSKSINEDFPSLFSEVSSAKSLLPMKSPSQNVSRSIKHDALSPTKSISVEASKSINDDYPSIFSDASAVKSPFLMTSTHNASKSTKHEAPSPTKSPLVEVSKSINEEFFLHRKSPFPDVLELTNQEVLTATASHDASESINRVTSLHIPEETVSPTKYPSDDASKSLGREVSSTIKTRFRNASKSATKQELPSLANKKLTSKRASSNEEELSISGSPKLKHINMKPASSLTSSGGSSGKTNSKRENSRTSVAAMKNVLTPPAASLLRKAKITSKAPKEKALTPPSASILLRTSVTRVAVSKARNNMGTVQQTEASRRHQKLIDKAESKKVGDETAQEKTLHIIEGRTSCKSSHSAQNKSRVIQSPAPVSQASLKSSFYAYSHSSHPNGVPDKCIKDYPTRKPSSEEESSAGVKLKFRRGKVVEPESETGPLERLRFKQARVLANSRGASGVSRRRSFRRRGADGGITSIAKLAAVKVVLRHQNVQGKKDGRVLLNNVIEETASKLVETRKSKVKALVGAFESVISLQEGRQSAERPPTETTIS